MKTKKEVGASRCVNELALLIAHIKEDTPYAQSLKRRLTTAQKLKAREIANTINTYKGRD